MAKVMRFIPPWGPYIEVDETDTNEFKNANHIGAPPTIFKEEGDDTIRGFGGGGQDPWAGAFAAPQQPAAPRPPSRPAPNPSFSGDGGGGGGGGWHSSVGTIQRPLGGTIGSGGNGMATATGGGIRQQFASLDPNVWGKYDPSGQAVNAYGQALGSAQAAGANAGAAAGSLMGHAPNVGGPDRTLYDRYSALLQNPSSMMNDQNVQFMLNQAQTAAQRQLAAGRMRHSGNALIELALVTQGNLMSQFGNLANIYGQGAQAELGRWDTQAGRQLEASGQRAAALGKAGDLYLGAGDLGVGAGMLGIEASKLGLGMSELELKRVQSGIQSPMEQYRAAQTAAANPYQPYTTASLTNQPGLGYGGAIPYNLSYDSWLTSNWGL